MLKSNCFHNKNQIWYFNVRPLWLPNKSTYLQWRSKYWQYNRSVTKSNTVYCIYYKMGSKTRKNGKLSFKQPMISSRNRIEYSLSKSATTGLLRNRGTYCELMISKLSLLGESPDSFFFFCNLFTYSYCLFSSAVVLFVFRCPFFPILNSLWLVQQAELTVCHYVMHLKPVDTLLLI